LSLTLWKEHKLFENRVQRKIFEPKRNEVIGDWKKLHNEELHDLYSSPIRIPSMALQPIVGPSPLLGRVISTYTE
jgi:hypothetical protein